MTVTASPVPILKDNYAWLLRDSATGATAIVDPAEAAPCIAAIEQAGGRLDLVLLTHHHGDHIAEADAVQARFGARMVGATAAPTACPTTGAYSRAAREAASAHATAGSQVPLSRSRARARHAAAAQIMPCAASTTAAVR